MEALLFFAQDCFRVPNEEASSFLEEVIPNEMNNIVGKLEQSFESNSETFDNLPTTSKFLEYFSHFKYAALQEGCNILVEAIKKDPYSSQVESCTIRCFMHDKIQRELLIIQANCRKKLDL